MRRLFAALLLGLMAAAAPAPAANAQDKDFFGRKAADAPAARDSGNLFQRATAQIALWQAKFRIWITGEIQAYKRGDDLTPALMIILISFLYGVFHAVGPGHGKVVTTSYFAANRARIGHGFMMGGLIALVQALSAIAIVGVFALVLNVAAFEIINPLTGTGHVIWVEIVSYALMLLVGLWLLWGAFVGRGCSHSHHGHGHDHTHDHRHDHDHEPAPVPSGWAMVPAAVASGLRPCSGAILVLLFTLANGIFLVGVLSTFAMGFGVAITITLVSVVTILIRRGLSGAVRPGVAAANLAHRAAGLAGGLVIVGAGILFLYAALERADLIA
jgi:ABC-type nickel/cobalt efflux system permease component RcnA